MSLRALSATLVVTVAVGAAPALADTFTLDEAMGIAYETNPTLEAQRANLRAADEQVAQANAGWRPSINAAGSYSVQRAAFTPQVVTLPNGTTLTVSDLAAHPVQGQLIVNQPLFRGGRTYAEIQRAKAIVHAGRAQLLAQEQTTLLNVVTAYMNVVRDRAIVSLRHQNVDVLTKQRNATKAEFDAGSLTKTDLAQSEARLAGAEADLTTAQGQLDISRAQFEDVVGRPAETLEEDPSVPKLPESVEPVLTLAARDNPSLLQAMANERAADYAVDDALGALAPSVSVQGQYQYSGGSLGSGFGTVGTGQVDHITSIVGQLTVPIYQGGAEEASVRQAKELHNQSKLNVDAAGRQVQDAVRTAWAVFVSFNATISSNQLQVNANQSAATGVQREQQVGGRTILDVLNAEQELLNAQVALVTARRNTVVAAYAVLASEGHLTAQDLGLHVKVYNPVEHYDEDHAKWFGLD